jgi:hypothetical protein
MTAIILYDVGVSSGLPSWHRGFHAGFQINAHYIGMLQFCGNELLYRCNYKSNPLCIKPQRLPAMQFDISLTMCTWAGYWVNWRKLLVAGQSKFCNYTPYSHTITLSTVGCCSRQHSNLRHITAPFFKLKLPTKAVSVVKCFANVTVTSSANKQTIHPGRGRYTTLYAV